jgi:uncharacterized membrane protein
VGFGGFLFVGFGLLCGFLLLGLFLSLVASSFFCFVVFVLLKIEKKKKEQKNFIIPGIIF